MINTQTPDYISNVKIAFLTVGTIINGTTYTLIYGLTPDDFDTNLPIIDKMIGSLEYLQTQLQRISVFIFIFILFLYLFLSYKHISGIFHFW
jgi:hypothetical protein